MIHQPSYKQRSRLRLISFEAIIKEPLPPIDWLVQRLIPQGTRTVVFGEFGCLKSWLLLDLGVHIAAGNAWLGEFPIPQARSVLYLDEEMPELELRRRVKRLGIGAGLESHALPFRAVSQLGTKFRDSSVEKLLGELRSTGFDPDVIIVETFRRVLDGNENEASDVSAFWHSVSPILLAGKTLIISHHMRKPIPLGHDASRHRASGSTDILAGTDCAYAVIRAKGQDAITVECVKSRVAEELPPFTVSLHDKEGEDRPIEMCYEGSTEQHEEAVKKEDQAVKLVERYFTEHPDVDASTGEVVESLRGGGVKERTAERALEKASKGGKITKVRHGVWRATELPKAV